MQQSEYFAATGPALGASRSRCTTRLRRTFVGLPAKQTADPIVSFAPAGRSNSWNTATINNVCRTACRYNNRGLHQGGKSAVLRGCARTLPLLVYQYYNCVSDQSHALRSSRSAARHRRPRDHHTYACRVLMLPSGHRSSTPVARSGRQQVSPQADVISDTLAN